jgi:hypothetical protein
MIETVGNGLTGFLGCANPNAFTDRDKLSSVTSTAKRSDRKENILIGLIVFAKRPRTTRGGE